MRSKYLFYRLLNLSIPKNKLKRKKYGGMLFTMALDNIIQSRMSRLNGYAN